MDHLRHFGLTRDPFANDPLVPLWFPSAEHTNAEQRLMRAVGQGKGLCVLTGAEGTGKTMVVRHLLEALEEEVYEACLLVPMVGVSDGDWVLTRFARQLGVEDPASDRSELLGQIYEQLAIVREDGRSTVLIIDEAQVLVDKGALGELRGLLNLEYEDRRLVTLVLVGLPALEHAIAEDSSLANRVDINTRIRSMDAPAATQYIAHRLKCVDGNPAILDPGALATLIELAGGAPRRLNTLADNALFEAFLAKRSAVTTADVHRAAADLQLARASDEVVESQPAVPSPVTPARETVAVVPEVPAPAGTPEPSATAVEDEIPLVPVAESVFPEEVPKGAKAASSDVDELAIELDELPALPPPDPVPVPAAAPVVAAPHSAGPQIELPEGLNPRDSLAGVLDDFQPPIPATPQASQVPASHDRRDPLAGILDDIEGDARPRRRPAAEIRGGRPPEHPAAVPAAAPAAAPAVTPRAPQPPVRAEAPQAPAAPDPLEAFDGDATVVLGQNPVAPPTPPRPAAPRAAPPPPPPAPVRPAAPRAPAPAPAQPAPGGNDLLGLDDFEDVIAAPAATPPQAAPPRAPIQPPPKDDLDVDDLFVDAMEDDL